MWKWIGNNERQIKLVFSVIAAVYIFVEYEDKMTQDRVANTMGYVHRYTSEPISQEKENLDSFWLSDQYAAYTQKVQKDNATGLYDKMLPKLLHTAKRDLDVYKILSFYREIDLCVHAKRCDSKTACDFFFEDMLMFRSDFSPLLEAWAKDLEDTAPNELSDFVEQTCSDNFIQFCKSHSASEYCKKGGSKAN